MSTQIYVNLPVKDLAKSKAFLQCVGFSFKEESSGETGACLAISNEIFAMLLTWEKFQEFTPKTICDAMKSTEVLLCLSRESRAEVDALVSRAIAAGGVDYATAKDHGFMYQHGFQDLDGHLWELIFMEPSGAKV